MLSPSGCNNAKSVIVDKFVPASRHTQTRLCTKKERRKKKGPGKYEQRCITLAEHPGSTYVNNRMEYDFLAAHKAA